MYCAGAVAACIFLPWQGHSFIVTFTSKGFIDSLPENFLRLEDEGPGQVSASNGQGGSDVTQGESVVYHFSLGTDELVWRVLLSVLLGVA